MAGGSSDADPALTLVEFFDLDQAIWMSLGRLREGRRFPGLLVMGKHLLGMVSHKMSLITIFGHKHFRQKFIKNLTFFTKKFSTASDFGSYLVFVSKCEF